MAQRAGAAQAALTYTTQTISNPPTQAEVQDLIDALDTGWALLNELRAALIEEGSATARRKAGPGRGFPAALLRP